MSSQRSEWRERLHANPSRMEQEIAIKLQDNGIHYQTQVEIPITIVDFYFPLESRPLLVFVDAGSTMELPRWRRMKSFDHSYGKEGTESWNYATTAIQIEREISFTKRCEPASPNWVGPVSVERNNRIIRG